MKDLNPFSQEARDEYARCMSDSQYLGDNYSTIEGDTLCWHIPEWLKQVAMIVEMEKEWSVTPPTEVGTRQRLINHIMSETQHAKNKKP